MLLTGDLVVWNNKITHEDKSLVGEEIASLGELAHHHVPILHRIVITPSAYNRFLLDNNLTLQLKHLLGSLNHDRHDSVTQISQYIKRIITKSELLEDIVKPLFTRYDMLKAKKVNLLAYFFQGQILMGKEKWEDLSGESVLAEHIRLSYSHLFSPGNLRKHTIHHNNHHAFTVTLVVEPQVQFELTGEVRTESGKGEYHIEAHKMVKFTYNKNTKKLEKGHFYADRNKAVLTVAEIKKLLDYARASEKALYLPHVLYWGKNRDELIVTKIIPVSDIYEHKNSYTDLKNVMTIHHGVTVGRLKVVNEKTGDGVILNDEIVVLKSLDKEMIETVKQAKGLILGEIPRPEVIAALKTLGIPVIVKNKESLLYSTGDIVSLNATTGEIKRGNLFVS